MKSPRCALVALIASRFLLVSVAIASNLQTAAPPTNQRVLNGATKPHRDAQKKYNTISIAPLDSPLARALKPRLARWRGAVIERNVSELLSFAWPEYRDSLRHKMTDQHSAGWKIMFGKDRSAREFLLKTDQRATIFEHEMVISGDNAVTCYSRGDIRWPRTYLSLVKMSNRKNVLCLDWTASDSDWYVDYSFAFGE